MNASDRHWLNSALTESEREMGGLPLADPEKNKTCLTCAADFYIEEIGNCVMCKELVCDKCADTWGLRFCLKCCKELDERNAQTTKTKER